MPEYQSISVIAAALESDEETLRRFRDSGWLQGVEKNNTIFFSSDQRYRAKYILYLIRTRNLDYEQVQLVLSVQRPPYSAEEVDQILSRARTSHPTAGEVDASV